MPTPARCGVRNYDMTPEEFSAMYDRLLGGDEAALRPAALLHADQAQPEVRQCRAARDRPDPRRSARQHVGAGMGQYLRRRRAEGRRRHRLRPHRPAREEEGTTPIEMVRIGERFYTSLGLAPLPADLLAALADHPPAGPRSGLPRIGLGPRQQGRPAHQDVHQGQCRRLRHHPPRAGPQLLSARLQPAAVTSISTAPTTASTRRSATSSRCR